jgi:hypothetical protein
MNLLKDSWLQVMYEDGSIGEVKIADIVDKSIRFLNFKRADLCDSGIYFLVGIINLIYKPKTIDDVKQLLENPPSKADFEKKILSYESYFDLFNEKTPFMQDSTIIIKEASVYSLILDAPMEKTIEDGKDFFRKDGDIKSMCPSCAAISLYTLQNNAYPGGVAYYTGIGFGAIYMLLEGKNLWETICLNVIPENVFSQFGFMPDMTINDLFPWISDNNGKTFSKDKIPFLGVYWAMPRRIKLIEEHKDGHCDCCGKKTDIVIEKILKTNKGIKYEKIDHPLDISTKIYTFNHKTISDYLYNTKSEKVKTLMNIGENDNILINLSKISFVNNATYVTRLDYRTKLYNNVELVKSMIKAENLIINKLKDMTIKKIHDSIVLGIVNKLEPYFYEILEGNSNDALDKWTEVVFSNALNVLDIELRRYIVSTKAIGKRKEFISWYEKKFEKNVDLNEYKFFNLTQKTLTPKFRFNHEAVSALYKWWSWLTEHNKSIYFSLKEINSIDDIKSDYAYLTLVRVDGEFSKNINMEDIHIRNRIAIAVLLSAQLKGSGNLNFDEAIAQTRFDLKSIGDIEIEWNKLYNVVEGIKDMNVVSLFEKIIGW